uniref:Discoidin domain-containing protein n=1 Tax=Anopheles stephensi TaxID=30069 RepID=A0A182YRZ6_ANOST
MFLTLPQGFTCPALLLAARVSHGSTYSTYIERYDWVGWRNDSLGWAGKPVEMVFEFDSVRNFSSMVLHTNNMFSKDVQL